MGEQSPNPEEKTSAYMAIGSIGVLGTLAGMGLMVDGYYGNNQDEVKLGLAIALPSFLFGINAAVALLREK
jgi:hypothetical protein